MGFFSRFLNCTNATKSRNTSQILIIKEEDFIKVVYQIFKTVNNFNSKAKLPRNLKYSAEHQSQKVYVQQNIPISLSPKIKAKYEYFYYYDQN